MPYITTMYRPTPKQITVDDILNDIFDSEVKIRHVTSSATMTRFVEEVNPAIKSVVNVDSLIGKLKAFNEMNTGLFESDRKKLYHEFYIPKKHGGLRKIDAPNEELKAALRVLVSILVSDFGMLYHTAAFAYIAGRSTIDDIKRHQANESKWFLKTDFSNFFGSTTLEFLMNQLSMIFPFSEVVKTDEGRDNLTKALSLGFLDGGLPQGTPLSPPLTNALMIPIDFRLAHFFNEHQMVYTRYADDILVSSKYSFCWKNMVDFINEVVRKEFNGPYMIKPEKTRYGSSAGRNWNLGVMLNKDNEITIGHAKKKQFKAMINNYICDYKRGTKWDVSDIQTMNGLMSYYIMIERDYITHVINEYNEKYGVDLKRLIKEDLGGRHTE